MSIKLKDNISILCYNSKNSSYGAMETICSFKDGNYLDANEIFNATVWYSTVENLYIFDNEGKVRILPFEVNPEAIEIDNYRYYWPITGVTPRKNKGHIEKYFYFDENNKVLVCSCMWEIEKSPDEIKIWQLFGKDLCRHITGSTLYAFIINKRTVKMIGCWDGFKGFIKNSTKMILEDDAKYWMTN